MLLLCNHPHLFLSKEGRLCVMGQEVTLGPKTQHRWNGEGGGGPDSEPKAWLFRGWN